MKTRLGFVSNSSSSSFLAILKKNEFDKIKFTSEELAFLEVYRTLNVNKLDNIELIIYQYTNGEDANVVSYETLFDALIKYATELDDPNLSIYQKLYNDAQKELKILEADKKKESHYWYIDFNRTPSGLKLLDYTDDAYNKVWSKFTKLEKLGLCITKYDNF